MEYDKDRYMKKIIEQKEKAETAEYHKEYNKDRYMEKKRKVQEYTKVNKNRSRKHIWPRQ